MKQNASGSLQRTAKILLHAALYKRGLCEFPLNVPPRIQVDIVLALDINRCVLGIYIFFSIFSKPPIDRVTIEESRILEVQRKR